MMNRNYEVTLERIRLHRCRRRTGPLPPYRSEWYESIARPEQRPPAEPWRIWLYCAGRGAGKSRAGAEWVQYSAMTHRGARIALVAPTAADVRDVMVEGESGILAIAPASAMPVYKPALRRLIWPNGSIATTFSADEPNRLRGPQHTHIWMDELCAWRYPSAFDMAMMGLRLGAEPQCVITTTPRPLMMFKKLLADKTVSVTRGSTYDNAANLAPAFLAEIVARYSGTRIGRQELMAELIEDVEGALWQRTIIESNRVASYGNLKRIVIGVDPKTTAGADSECGIVVAAINDKGELFVLEDASINGSPEQWARQVAATFHRWNADRVVVEVNQGGDMVSSVLRAADLYLPISEVRATEGKRTRAEPISALYEQNRVHHVGTHMQLEDQLCGWVPGNPSPDRLDALVWACFALMVRPPRRATSREY